MGKVKRISVDNLYQNISSLSSGQGFKNFSQNGDAADNFFSFGYKLGLVMNEGFLKFRLDTVTPRSKIVSAKLEMTSGAAIAAPNGYYVGVLRRDDKWDRNYSSPAGRGDLFNVRMGSSGTLERFRLLVRDGLSNLGDTGVAAASVNGNRKFSYSHIDPVNGELPYVKSVGQVVNLTSSGTLTNVVVRIDQVGAGTLTPNAIAKVFSVNASFEPVTLLATSDVVVRTSIGTSPTDTLFNFSGINQIALSSGTYIGVSISGDTEVYNNSVYYRLYSQSDVSDTDANERVFTIAATGGFGFGSYADRVNLPFLYQDNSLIFVNRPNGTVLQKSIGPHSAASSVTVTGLEKIIQEWVDSPEFIQSRQALGLVFSPGNIVWTQLADFHNINLVLEWEPRRIGIS